MYRDKVSVKFQLLILVMSLNVLACTENAESVNTNTEIQLKSYATATINWIASREMAVNSPNGGYRVYYSTTSPVTIDHAYTDVSYDAVSDTTPTTASINFDQKGQYYIAVQAYSGLNANLNIGSVSDLSTEYALKIQ